MDSNNNDNRSALASARAARERAEASMARTAAIVAESRAATSASRAARERSGRARERRTAASLEAEAVISDAQTAISSAQAFQEWMAQRMRERETAAAARSAALNANMPPRPPRIQRIRIPRNLPVSRPGNAVLNVISAVSLDDDSFNYASLHTETKRPQNRIKKVLPKRRAKLLPARLRNREELDLRPFL